MGVGELVVVLILFWGGGEVVRLLVGVVLMSVEVRVNMEVSIGVESILWREKWEWWMGVWSKFGWIYIDFWREECLMMSVYGN